MPKISDWQDGRSLTVELSEFNFPFKSAKARVSARPDGNDRTEVGLEHHARTGELIGRPAR
jgi:hypothetical protein